MAESGAKTAGTTDSAEGSGTRFHWFRYLALLTLGLAILTLIRSFGEHLSPPQELGPAFASNHKSTHQVDVVFHVTATLSMVIMLSYILGKLARLFRQPPVIGEILGGILLGPSVLGAISPTAMHFFLPGADQDPLGKVTSAMQMISQLGIILYMFLMGLELNAAQLRGKLSSAIAISHSSIAVQFIIGGLLALWIYPLVSYQQVSFTSFALFMGVAMSITALPVLARILFDRDLHKSPVGVLALACAATDDFTAWSLLAIVIGVAKSEIGGGFWVGALSILYAICMFTLVRPWIVKASKRIDSEESSLPAVAIYGTFAMLFFSSFITEAIGIHAVFGAFLFGVLIPHDGRIAQELNSKLRDPVLVLLLPAFFAFTGMRTQIGLLDSPSDWFLCIVICTIATVGKFGTACLVSRFVGNTWRDSLALGTLMNTRGLMEIIVLNIGLELGVISPKLFAMMVIMAIVTTMMTGPILSLLLPPPKPELST